MENQYEMVNGDATTNENAPRREVTVDLAVQSVAPVTGSGPILPSRRLVQMLWGASCFFFVATLTGIATGIWKSSLIGLVALSLLLMALWLARKGYVQRAAAMMLGTLTLSVSYLSFLNQGIDGPGVIAFPAILLLAAMFSTRLGLLDGLGTDVLGSYGHFGREHARMAYQRCVATDAALADPRPGSPFNDRFLCLVGRRRSS